jgi:TonB family protein
MIILQALLSTPVLPKKITSGLSVVDYPAESLRNDEQGAILTRLTVSPEGKVINCEILSPSKYPRLNKVVCPGLRHSKYSGAYDQNGRPAYGTVEEWSTFSTEGVMKMPDPVDIDLTVNRLPESVSVNPTAHLVVVLDSTGKVEACPIASSTGSDTLDNVACSSGVQAARIAPIKNETGSYVESVQSLNVEFSTGKPATQ